MAQTATRYFGSIDFEPSDVVQFPHGLPAFEEELEFLLLRPPASAPVVFLQSLRRPSLCFLALPIEAIIPDYRLSITREDLETEVFVRLTCYFYSWSLRADAPHDVFPFTCSKNTSRC